MPLDINSKSKINEKKYFRLIEQKNTQSSLSKQNKSQLFQKINNQDPLKATINLIRNNKYIYVDMNSTNGFKVMQNVQTQSDDDDQRYGPYIVCDGVKTSKQKSKLHQFITINYANRQKNNILRSKIKSQLNKQINNINLLYNNSQVNNKKHHKNSNIFHRGINIQKFNKIKSSIDTELINQDILNKQSKIIQKFGIIADYQSVNDKTTPSYNQKTKRTRNYFLPRILKPYNI